MTGGLGRTLADIRADVEGAGRGPRNGAGPQTTRRVVDDLVRILAGAATDEPPEFGTPTPAQWWARLLTLEPAERLAAIGWLMHAADAGHECWNREHEGRYERLEQRHRDLMAAVHAGQSVRVLCVDDQPVAWHPELDTPEGNDRHGR